jgi:hypothetical protein
LKTVIVALPGVRMSLVGMVAVSWELLRKVVVRSRPFHRTIELEMKLEPKTVRVKLEALAGRLEGERREVSVGTGLGISSVAWAI